MATIDPGESFNVTSRHPDVVKDLQTRIAAALATFPEKIRKANQELLEAQKQN
jgi:hypothetical protein